ncbi:hypothetical protein GCK32_022786 [Trichostrongylus colubriformis]|uniref:Uncharacterized protein n=1 Tax=Trichostrongylus colubriformis TaxID=6319 RepID=A0AAN8IBA2_TRICO
MDDSSTTPPATGTSTGESNTSLPVRSTSSSQGLLTDISPAVQDPSTAAFISAPSASLQQLLLNPPSVSAEDAQSTITAPVPKRPRSDAFSNYRDGPSSSSRRSPPPLPAAPAGQTRHSKSVPYL